MQNQNAISRPQHAEAVVNQVSPVSSDNPLVELLPIFHRMTEESPLPMVFVEGPTHVVRYANPAFLRLVQANLDQLLGSALADVIRNGHPDDCIALLDRVFRTKHAETLEQQEEVRTGLPSVYWSYVAWPVGETARNDVGVALQVTDSTCGAELRVEAMAVSQALILSEILQHELVDTAQQLNARLQRAVRETNHRVKNNLQVVAALVDLESDGVKDNPAMIRLQHHVRALATIHDLVAQQSAVDADFTSIPAELVVASLLGKLQQTFSGKSIIGDIADVALSSKRSAAMALVINECVSNAVKHGANAVSVTLRVADGMTHLEVTDDGPGFSPGFDPVKAANIGLELIVSVAHWDLQGTISFDNCLYGGARVVVKFPIDTSVPQPTM
jgi:two-component sensor histidine kinase